ncbi:inositol monophosphatase [Actinoplanes lobatus]|uniref:Inositol-1-monophosphatase n=1 Tax=Actinoplanes lobatus TaxID=113568 RepID=A0A7W7HMA3_9ACTN|nr:inositol monophosphatase family protein [Actinoplanes lobatus]MBB4753086.1 myo-inositol-1(or 4)-monophosphatase [Actinoplanes lobatus]GGN87107.1 inositol monophosphatase [Actinoplanes lobatus]GIE39693.1 inositol monophosphatase [Actinoplanes lobatus]
MTDPALSRQLLTVAVRAAHAGGAVLARAGATAPARHKSSPTDPVTEVDLASEAAIVAVLAADRPGDGLLGEEGATRTSRTGLRWVIDPVDGTTNLLYGSPHVTVSIAVERQAADGSWQPVAGVVHDPARSETFTATRGGGAHLNGEPIRANDPVPLDRALVATGFAYGSASRDRQAQTVRALLSRVRDVRSHGSAALELCWLAAGRCDAYYEDELARWDWAAGALVAAEAGATVTPLATGVLAAGPTLHPALVAALT